MQIFINVPWYFSVLYSVFSPFLTQRTKSKFVISNEGNVAETLYKWVPLVYFYSLVTLVFYIPLLVCAICSMVMCFACLFLNFLFVQLFNCFSLEIWHVDCCSFPLSLSVSLHTIFFVFLRSLLFSFLGFCFLHQLCFILKWVLLWDQVY